MTDLDLDKRDAAVRERDEAWETVSVQQQLIDSIIVACGSLGLMQSELPKHVSDLRAKLAAAEAAKHEHATHCLDEAIEIVSKGGMNVRRKLSLLHIREQEAAAKAARGQA